MKNLAGKSFVVVGGANGIGQATVDALIEYKCRVVVFDKDGGRLRDLIDNDRRWMDHVCPFVGNLSSPVCIEGLRQFVSTNSPTIDGLVNIAAEAVFETFSDHAESWQKIFTGSAAAYSIIVKKLLPYMSQSGASIVNMSSISAHIAQPGFGTYSASKAAISALTRCMALDLSPKNIRVNSISPGTIWTENNAYYIKKQYGFNRTQADNSSLIGGKHLLRRCGDPSEVAQAILFLLSDSASFITGIDLVVDGGYLVQ